jgi:hypothetical protein
MTVPCDTGDGVGVLCLRADAEDADDCLPLGVLVLLFVVLVLLVVFAGDFVLPDFFAADVPVFFLVSANGTNSSRDL